MYLAIYLSIHILKKSIYAYLKEVENWFPSFVAWLLNFQLSIRSLPKLAQSSPFLPWRPAFLPWGGIFLTLRTLALNDKKIEVQLKCSYRPIDQSISEVLKVRNIPPQGEEWRPPEEEWVGLGKLGEIWDAQLKIEPPSYKWWKSVLYLA